MVDKTQIADRMKDFYEKRSRTYLTRRTPVIIRLDGRAFHTFTKGFKRPFSEDLNIMMRNTTKALCKEIQGAKLGYTQSDEISILVTDYDTLTTEAWFDYQIQKICSVSASIATTEFNLQNLIRLLCPAEIGVDYDYAIKTGIQFATFDSRCFNIPREEVTNYFVWRQLDWLRNSSQMLGQSLFSHKELHGKTQGEVKTMCRKKGYNWHELPDKWRNGNVCIKTDCGWDFKEDVGDFKSVDFRDYIDYLITEKE